jgi:hypothetical protein
MDLKDDLKTPSRGISREISPEAIAHRLDIASQLHELVTVLEKSQPVGAGQRAPPPAAGSTAEPAA